MINKTVILIFANSAKKEVERKPFLSSDVFDALNTQILKTVERTKLPYFVFSEENQIGNSFGERFTNAIEVVFKKGFENIITIGNDTPHLTKKHLLKTSQKLSRKDLVLGPSKDGGFYLMGINKSKFNKKTFLKFPWQTNYLNQYISKIAKSNNLKLEFLELLQDLDSKKDIIKIISNYKRIPFLIFKLLSAIILINKKQESQLRLYDLDFYFSEFFNKGSPIIFE